MTLVRQKREIQLTIFYSIRRLSFKPEICDAKPNLSYSNRVNLRLRKASMQEACLQKYKAD